MHWGNKLLLVFGGFGCLMTYMVYRCMKTPVNLVAREYYRDELAYQAVIDSKKEVAQLNSQVKLQQEQDSISIRLPREMKDQVVKGQVHFYCAADAGRDRRFDLVVNAAGWQQVSTRTLLPGRYLVKLSWEAGNKHYYTEETFTIQ